MAAHKVRMFEGEEDLSIALADYIAELSEASIKERGAFTIALSGGLLIRLLGKLTKPPYLKTVEWSNWYVFWAEEKVIPGRKLESNYMQAKEEFLSKVPIPLAQINPVSQTGSVSSAAEGYEYTIRQLVRNRTIGACMSTDCPRFDLILLVLRRDGYASSIWSDSSEESEWVRPVSLTEQDPANSVALSLSVINSATNLAVVATGRAGRPMLTDVLGPGVDMPAHPFTGKVVWFVHLEAASASN